MSHRLSTRQCFVMMNVFSGHSHCRKPLFKARTDTGSIKLVEQMYSLHSFFLAVDDEAGNTVVDNFRHRP